MNLHSLSASSARATTTETQPLSLKEGQMIHGKITQLFSGQMAQVQVGNQQLYAKLEVPMQAGDNYYFKVNGTEPELRLQVISGPMRGEGQSVQLSQLIESLSLPKTKEMKDVLATIVKQKIPMTKENMLEAVNLLKTLPEGMKAEALATLGKMAEARLPFTPAIFQSLLQAHTGTIAQQFTTLQTTIQSEPNLPPAMREQLLVTMQALSSPLSQAVGKELLNQTVSQLLNSQASQADRFAALQLLKSADILPARTSLANLPQVLAEQTTKADTLPANVTSVMTNQTEANKAIQSLITQLSQTPVANQQTMKAVVQNITQQLPNTTLPESVKNALQTVMNQITQQPMTDRAKAIVVEQFSNVFTQVTATQTVAPSAPSNTALIDQLQQATAQQASRQETAAISSRQPTMMKEEQQSVLSLLVPQNKENEAIRALMQTAEKSGSSQVKQLIQHAETQVSQTVNGPVMKEAIQQVLSTLGVNYEAMLGGKEPDVANLASTLKPQLLAMLQDPSLSPALREAAETMVLRMNGTLLQSGETGTQQQLIMQLPLEMFGKKIDATLQWNSRMKENGKIDPAFARILFYLELESLATTLVDMHVQNKVVNLTIYNDESSLKTTGATFQDVLKEGLEGVGYKLSGVMFKAFTEKQQNIKKAANTFQLDEGGVDYRI
ncbi:hypothetical protein [Sporosarcina ureae]|uniref:hypothetical protein n=1 Tax=Sporosarcina ureae TaxID=1571 RepID=UPI0009DC551B|nr:hypothetical protein [Sporosarcina ureae]ARF18437.1 hypothetical protein SporoP17a_14790 [Sporosarcina ureae]